MPIADVAATFLHGLSDLWLRFFKDKNQLAAMYRGTENLMGQVYLDLLDTVLNISVRNTPIFNKEYYKFLTIRADQVTFNPATNRWEFELPGNLKDFQILCNKVLDPTVVLEKDIDFDIDITGTVDLLQFKANPFTAGTGGGPLDGVAWRTVDVLGVATVEIALWAPNAQFDRFVLYLNYGQLLGYFSPSSEAYKALIQGIMQYFILGPTLTHVVSTLNVCAGLPVIRDEGEILQSIDTTDPLINVVKTDKHDYTFPSTVPLRTDVLDTAQWGVLTLGAYEVLTTLFRVVDSIEDPTWWYNETIPSQLTYDPATGLPEPRWRRDIDPNLLETKIGGNWRVGDPGVYVGADEDGRVPSGARYFIRYDMTNDIWYDESNAAMDAAAGELNLLSTDPHAQDRYYFGFDSIYDAYHFDLNISNQGVGVWTLEWRYLSNAGWTAFPWLVDGTAQFMAPIGACQVSWPFSGGWVKATWEGHNAYWVRARLSAFVSMVAQPRATVSVRLPMRHSPAFIEFERYMQHHIFAILYDETILQTAGLPYPIYDVTFSSIIVAGKPAYVFMHADPGIVLNDTLPAPTDSMLLTVQPQPLDLDEGEENIVTIGGGWSVGDYYVYSPAGITIANGAYNPALGETPVVVGGANPYVTVTPLSPTNEAKFMDWPVQVTVT